MIWLQAHGYSVGKLSLYTACAGINRPNRLPVTIDTGTGERRITLQIRSIWGCINAVCAVKSTMRSSKNSSHQAQSTYPRAVIQFEDFAISNAFDCCIEYRHRARVFNDMPGERLYGGADCCRQCASPQSELREQTCCSSARAKRTSASLT